MRMYWERIRRLMGWGVLLVTLIILPSRVKAATAPKAYVGLFKDNAVAVIDTGSNTVLKTIPVPAGPHGLVITGDGSTVYVSSDGDSKVSVIDTASDTVSSTIEVGKTPHGLALTPDGKQLLVADFGTDSVVFVDTATGKVSGQVSVPAPHNITISADGKTAYVAAQKKGSTSLVRLNVTDKTVVTSLSLDNAPRALNLSPDGKQLYFTEVNVDAVEVFDTAANKIVGQIPVGASPHHPLFTSDGEYGLVVSQKTNELTIIDPAKNAVDATIAVGKMPHWIALTADNKTAYVTNEASNDVSVVDLESHKVTATISVGQAPRKIVIQPGAMMSATMEATAGN